MSKFAYVCPQCEKAGEIDSEKGDLESAVCEHCGSPVDLSNFVVGW